MAWTLQLTDGTTTVDLNDGTNTFLNLGGFYAPPPPRNLSLAGPNLARHGAGLIERTYQNRTVTVNFDLKANDASTLGSRIGSVWDILRKGEEFNKDNVGTQVQLKYQWESATNPVFFNVIEGVLDLGPDLHNIHLSRGTRVREAELTLLCEPFAYGTRETLENYVNDPSFEIAGSAFADWTKVDGTGTTTRVTSEKKYGTASARTVRTAGTAQNGVSQVFTSTFTAGDTLSFGSWIYYQAGTSGMGASIYVEYFNSGGTLLSSATADITATGTAFTLVKLEGEVVATNAGTGTVKLSLILRGGTGTGTVFWDGVMIAKASTLPKAWISGRNIGNHLDDNGQQHINYIDMYDIPGDIGARVQIKSEWASLQNEFWAGARHSSRQGDSPLYIEGESFTGSGFTATAETTASNGSVGLGTLLTTAGSASAPIVSTYDIVPPSPQGQFRLLARVNGTRIDGTGTGTVMMGVGYKYANFGSSDPSTTTQYLKLPANTDRPIKDFGVLTVPTTKVPEGATAGTLQLRLAYYMENGGSPTGSCRLWIDWLMLFPVDQGGIYGTMTENLQRQVIDGLSEPTGLYTINKTNSVIFGFVANQAGAVPELHPKGSRIYFFLNDGTGGTISRTHNVSVTYLPRFLHVST